MPPDKPKRFVSLSPPGPPSAPASPMSIYTRAPCRAAFRQPGDRPTARSRRRAVSQADDQAVSAAQRSATILVVEDDPNILVLLRDALTIEGHRVDVAKT